MLPAKRIDDAARMYAPVQRTQPIRMCRRCSRISTGLPPLSMHVGTTEILLDDSRRLVDRARAHGVAADATVWPRMPHVFPMFADVLPEGRRALREIQRFVDAHLAPAPAAMPQ